MLSPKTRIFYAEDKSSGSGLTVYYGALLFSIQKTQMCPDIHFRLAIEL